MPTNGHGAGIDFDQTHDVGINVLDELDDFLEVLLVVPQIASARNRQIEGRSGTSRVTDVVEEETHGLVRCGRHDPTGPRRCKRSGPARHPRLSTNSRVALTLRLTGDASRPVGGPTAVT